MIMNLMRNLSRKVFAPDPTAPQLLGPDRNPAFRDSEARPLFRFYDPNKLDYNGLFFGPKPLPLLPNGPNGRNSGFGFDLPREPQVTWDRSSDGAVTMAFFRAQQKQTGLGHQ